MYQPATLTSDEPEPLSSQEVHSLRALNRLLSDFSLSGKLMIEKVYDKLTEIDKSCQSLLGKLDSLESFFKSQKDFVETPVTDHTMLKVKRFTEDMRKTAQRIMFALLQEKYNGERLVTKHDIKKFSSDLKAFYESLQTFLYSGQIVFYYNFDESIIEPDRSIPLDLRTLGSGMQYTIEQSSFIVLLDSDAKTYTPPENHMPRSEGPKVFEDSPPLDQDIEQPAQQISLMPVLTSVMGSGDSKRNTGNTNRPNDPSLEQNGDTTSVIDNSEERGSLEGVFADVTIAAYWFDAVGSSVEAYLHACNLQHDKNLEKSLSFALAVTSVSAFFASVDVSAIQLYYSVPIANAVAHRAVGVCWFTSLVLSTCGVLSGLFSAGYAQSSLDLPIGMYIFLTFGPVALTAVSAVSFAIGFCIFAHATSAKVVADFSIASTSILFFYLYVMMSIFVVKDYAESKSSKKNIISLFWLPIAALLTLLVILQSLVKTTISFLDMVVQLFGSAWRYIRQDKRDLK